MCQVRSWVLPTQAPTCSQVEELSPLYRWGNRGMRHESHLPRAPRAEVAASVGISAWSPGHSGLHQARERCSREMRSPSPSFQSVESAPTETDWPFKNRWEF